MVQSHGKNRTIRMSSAICRIGTFWNSIECNTGWRNNAPALRKIPGNEQMIENSIKINPGGRLTVPEDIAHIIGLIGCSEESWMTGNTIRVDGGEDITDKKYK